MLTAPGRCGYAVESLCLIRCGFTDRALHDGAARMNGTLHSQSPCAAGAVCIVTLVVQRAAGSGQGSPETYSAPCLLRHNPACFAIILLASP